MNRAAKDNALLRNILQVDTRTVSVKAHTRIKESISIVLYAVGIAVIWFLCLAAPAGALWR
ncbi:MULTISPECIES: hypothetical protein [unclassified Caballeronia]|uniref:hypothetical protein n=1 Tax=unclassified Caballeronia TaxID=2646786 RepID=UPI002861DEC4|nr:MULTISPECIES: hypothetical protein [unclassified Caballeronia]MDR5777599.1 hypothetical protein [Caballeronia sp. LZ002]MDR5802355.1 hypothetical protein [Caballeronia sp. LZ001]MDR5853027.1 hypothetical protein [Caballeronia sp. LZ003]